LAAAGSVTLAGETSRVPLLPSAGAANLRRQLADLGQQRPLFLVLDDLQASDQPGIVYEVYVGLPRGKVPTSDDRHYVGTLNFFAVAPPNTVRRTRSYNVTALVPILLSQGSADDGIAVTIVARTGSPSASSGPATIGRVALIAQ
jgi:hypothetical protein